MTCALCEGTGELVSVAHYRIDVCAECWARAENGWPKAFERCLMIALTHAGLLIPDRNSVGLLPRDYAPPADFKL